MVKITDDATSWTDEDEVDPETIDGKAGGLSNALDS